LGGRAIAGSPRKACCTVVQFSPSGHCPRSLPHEPGSALSRLEPDLRKAELIEATLTCLKRHGFQGASIRKISAEAGVSVGLISHQLRR